MIYKPHGHTSVSPYLIVADIGASLAFIKAVFESEPLTIVRHDDGTPKHAEVKIDDTIVMIGQMPGGPDAHIHAYLPDLEDAFRRAIDAGGTVIEEPAFRADEGSSRGAVRDPQGTTWWLARREG